MAAPHVKNSPAKEPETNSRTNLRFFAWGGALFALNSVLAASIALYWTSLGDALIAVGCFASGALYRKKERLCWLARNPWVPAYSGLWVGSVFLLYFSGGIRSPYLAELLILLFAAAAAVQERLPASRFAISVVLYFSFWVVASMSEALPAPEDSPVWLISLRTAAMVSSSVYLIWMLLTFERRLKYRMRREAERLMEAQTLLGHADRMTHIGTLVASTAHELSQPIQVIQNAAALMSLHLKRGSLPTTDCAHLVRQISIGSGRLSRLLLQLRDYSRKDLFEPSIIDLREAMDATRLLVGHDLKARQINTLWELPETPLWANADSLMVQQVLLNLINNARDAASSSSDPEIAIRAEYLERGHSRWVRFSISNNGPGIPLELHGRIFESFFTTKERGKGTGLGLMVIARIVDQHQGRIYFASDENRTTFVVDFPPAITQPMDVRSIQEESTSISAN